MVFEMILLATSQTPIGRTPGHLSKAIRRQARKGARPDGCTKEVHKCLASNAREWQSSADAALKAEHILFQPWASMPEGPAAPSVQLAAERIKSASMQSNTTG